MNISADTLRLIDEIRNDKVQGASYLARQAIEVLKKATEYSQAYTPE